MFHEPYTPAVARALWLAQRLAAHAARDEVGPQDLLRALLQEEEGRPFVLLTQAGVSAAEARDFAPAVAGPFAEESPASPLGDRVQHALRLARTLARELSGERTVSSEHLLLTLLQEAGELRGELEGLGLVVRELERRVLSLAEGPPVVLREPLELEDVPEQSDTARVLDANANRAREALRVLEDYCRFVLDDAGLSRELKELRHGLAEALRAFPAHELLAARDTEGDVGTGISTAGEQSRHSLREVVRANAKRLQEALRSLEEYSKLRDPVAGHRVEEMRYRAYTLERQLLLGGAARERLAGVRLYLLLTGAQCYGPLEWTVREAAAGGVQAFQLREKNLPDRELLERARQVRRWSREAGALFIVNDRPDLARLAEADGVHLGQDELPVREARRLLGPDALIGVSTHDLDQLRQALRDGASYAGVGPTFPSQTKAFADFPGLDYVRAAAAETSLPAFVIGGVTLANLPAVIAAGGRRVAVGHSLCASDSPQALARAMRLLLDAAGES